MEDKKNEIKIEGKSEVVNVQTVPDKIIPKFCTQIDVAVVNDKNIVLSMFYTENKKDFALIERIAIDLKHAQSLHDVLTKILKNRENDLNDFTN